MKNRKKIYEDFFAKKESEAESTINDLRDKEFREEKLSEEEGLALINFDRFRLAELNKTKTDLDFNARYCQLQILANLAGYKEFLKEEYFGNELL